MRHAKLCLIVVAVLLGPAVVTRATTVLPAEFTEMVDGSHLIVHGTVTAVRSQLAGPRRTIESVVTVDVIEPIKGSAGRQVVFRVPNGEVGRYRRVTVGAPQFAAGDEVVLFLSGRPPVVPMPFGLHQGVYRVTRTGGAATVAPVVTQAAGRVVRGDPARRPASVAAFTRAVRAAMERP